MLIINLDDSQAQSTLAQLLRNTSNSRVIMQGLATELETMTTDNFENEAFGGQAWVRKAFGNGKTLTNTGELKDSVTSSATSHTASVGTNMIYARIHHFGGIIRPKQKSHLIFATPNDFAKVKSVTLPARPFLPISPDGQLQSDGDRRLIEVALSALTSGT